MEGSERCGRAEIHIGALKNPVRRRSTKLCKTGDGLYGCESLF